VTQTIAITGGHVVPIEGDPVDGGTVLLRDGKIAAVEGPGFAVPDDAEVVDAENPSAEGTADGNGADHYLRGIGSGGGFAQHAAVAFMHGDLAARVIVELKVNRKELAHAVVDVVRRADLGPAGIHRGWLLDMIWHLLLPILCLTYGQFAYLSKLSRGAVLETMNADFVRTARAKGVDEKNVLYQHVLRNSLIPLITVAAHILPAMIAGAVIVERIFGINGMGNLLVDAVSQRDRELVLSITLVSGVLGLAGYLLADIGYAIADPRVSYE